MMDYSAAKRWVEHMFRYHPDSSTVKLARAIAKARAIGEKIAKTNDPETRAYHLDELEQLAGVTVPRDLLDEVAREEA